MRYSFELDSSQVSGKITYNGHTFDEFVPQRTSSYISQTDNHIGELTVRETLDFAARCQGVGYKYGPCPLIHSPETMQLEPLVAKLLLQSMFGVANRIRASGDRTYHQNCKSMSFWLAMKLQLQHFRSCCVFVVKAWLHFPIMIIREVAPVIMLSTTKS